MYDSLYEPFLDDVEVVVHADHPTLNRRVAELLAAGERIDVLSTHGKYAPSQAAWLRPLDQLLDPATINALAPRAVDLCRFHGALLCAPRNIDVRTLWWRTDRLGAPPATWDELVASDAVFGFTGRESGLFGLFFELVVGNGGALFDDEGRPTMTGPEAQAAVALLCDWRPGAGRSPDWHYDDVDRALLDGRVDCAAAWPGGYGPIRASALYDVLAPAPYFGGSTARVSYSGVHGWAIPTTCGDLDGAVELVTRLCSAEMHEREAAAGGIPARTDVLSAMNPLDATDAARLAITRDTIEHGMITYPPLVRFPEVEDAGWGAINAALRGELTPSAAVASIQHAAEAGAGSHDAARARVCADRQPVRRRRRPRRRCRGAHRLRSGVAVLRHGAAVRTRLVGTTPRRRARVDAAAVTHGVATKVGRVLVPDDVGGPDQTIFADVPPVHPVFDFSADGVAPLTRGEPRASPDSIASTSSTCTIPTITPRRRSPARSRRCGGGATKAWSTRSAPA